MSHERLIRFDGKVVALLADGHYRVRFPDGVEVTGTADTPKGSALSVGDSITVEISPSAGGLARLVC